MHHEQGSAFPAFLLEVLYYRVDFSDPRGDHSIDLPLAIFFLLLLLNYFDLALDFLLVLDHLFLLPVLLLVP